jgi:hypothetical protein
MEHFPSGYSGGCLASEISKTHSLRGSNSPLANDPVGYLRDTKAVQCFQCLPILPIGSNGKRNVRQQRHAGMSEVEKGNTMKIVFTLNPLVASLLPVTIDAKKVENSCESYRNRMAFVKNDDGSNKEKSERRLRVAGNKSSGFAAKERVTYSAERIGDLNGESNVVARFIAYNDEITLLQNRLAKVEGNVQLVQIPLEFSAWLAKHPVVGERAPAGVVAMTPANGVVEVKENGTPAKPARTPRNRLQPA